MSSKDTKIILKEVREHIKLGENDQAVEKCQNLLKSDPNNYMGCLLIGAAYQNTNKSEAARYLRIAVQNSPASPAVALQGLSNCAPIIELPKIYAQLLELVPEKYEDYYQKLYSISSNDSVLLEIINVFKRELQNHKNEQRQQLILKHLATIWLNHDTLELNESDEKLLRLGLEKLITDENHDLWLLAYKRFLKLAFKQNDLVACVKQACQIIEKHPNEIYAYEWICKIYTENYKDTKALWQSELKRPVLSYAEVLLSLNENSSLAHLVKSITLYEQQQYVAARDSLYKVQNVQSANRVALELLARTEIIIGAFRSALPILKDLGTDFQCDYAICLAQDNDVEMVKKAVEILVNCPQTEDCVKALARCYFVLQEKKKLNELNLDDLSRMEYTMPPNEAIEMLKSHGTLDANSFECLYLLGKLHMKLEKWSEALVCMLRATKLRSYYADCFFCLAQIYHALGDDIRTKKCYEKGLNLYPLNDTAVNMLSAIYQEAGEDDQNYALLMKTLNSMKSNEWSHILHYRLGLHYLRVNKWDDAIQSFRHAIKSDLTCITFWESLGDAYAERGSFNSAIRVFEKVLEMQPTNIYAKLQIALIKTTIRNFTEAIVEFDKLLLENGEYLPSLKGAAEAHIGLAANLKAENRYGRCKEHLQFAVNYLQRAFLVVKKHDMVWLWRLTASVFLQTAQLPLSLANLDVDGKLAKRDEKIVFLTRQDLFKLATRFYTCALNIKQNTFLWYDLAVCVYLNAIYVPEEANDRLELSIKACYMAINEQNSRWQNWNLLGVIYMHESKYNLKLAQHCFIQALNLERKSYTTWTNLGVLYLTLNDIKLANQAFQRAQQASPIYAQAWIGQAMIAEQIGEEEEALDLFRHCQQFDYHPEAALGYAHWVCQELSNAQKCELPHIKHAIYNMHADVVALDAIRWYTQNEENECDVSAYTFEGFLCDREELYSGAEKVYLQGYKSTTKAEERDKIFTNLGYLYMKMNKPHESIKAFNLVSEATFKPIIGLALAYAMVDQNQESYSMYNSLLKSVADHNDNTAAQILVAMAAMVYKFQGEIDTKTILYQCILLENSPIEALYAACALGILHNDNSLVDTMLSELKKRENMLENVADIAFLNAQYLISQKRFLKARLHLISRVHVFPHCAELRKVLANFLSNYFEKEYSFATSQIALSVIELVHRQTSKNASTIPSAEDAKLLQIAARASQHQNPERALKLIQRAIRLQPQDKQLRLYLNEYLI